jgi:hypothetical protein
MEKQEQLKSILSDFEEKLLTIYEALDLIETLFNGVSETKVKFIPYQRCPICNGEGNVMVNNCWGGGTGLTVGFETCKVCNGRLIIPMYALSPNLSKISSMIYGEDGIGLSCEEISKLL